MLIQLHNQVTTTQVRAAIQASVQTYLDSGRVPRHDETDRRLEVAQAREHRGSPDAACIPPQIIGMVKRYNGHVSNRYCKVTTSGPAKIWRQPFTVMSGYYNQKLSQPTSDSQKPLSAMKEWHKRKPEPFKKKSCCLSRCNIFSYLWIRGNR